MEKEIKSADSLEELEQMMEENEEIEEKPFLQTLHELFLSVNNLEEFQKGRNELRLYSYSGKEFRRKMKEENIDVYGASVLKKGSTNIIYGNEEAFINTPYAASETFFTQLFLLYYKDIEYLGEMDAFYKRMKFFKKAAAGFKQWIEFQAVLFAINTTNSIADNESYESVNRIDMCVDALKQAELLRGYDRISSFMYVMAHLMFLENRFSQDESDVKIDMLKFEEQLSNKQEGVILNKLYKHLLNGMDGTCNMNYFMRLQNLFNKLEKECAGRKEKH